MDNKIESIIGSLGAGKPTLLRSISLLETPSSGKMVLENSTYNLKHIHEKDKQDIRKRRLWFFKIITCLRIKPPWKKLKPI